jgi:hypothetical protein
MSAAMKQKDSLVMEQVFRTTRLGVRIFGQEQEVHLTEKIQQ